MTNRQLVLLFLSVALSLGCATIAFAQEPNRAVGPNERACSELRERGPEFQVLSDACRYAVAAPRTLPDFVCTETVKRFFSPKDKPEIVTAQLTVEKTHSHYEGVTVNGKRFVSGRSGDDVFEEKAGSTGEFAMLFNLFEASSRAEFTPPVEVRLGRQRLQRYDFRVQRANNVNWTWWFPGTSLNPGYHGSLFVESSTGKVFRLVVKVGPDEVDAATPVSDATTTIDYGDVAIGAAGTHHLPVRGEAISCFRFMTGCVRAVIAFDDFHKFGVDTRIVGTPQ